MIARQTHRRYANAKSFRLFKDVKPLGTVGINEKDEAEEKNQLREVLKMSKADKVVLVWTAREGECEKEMQI